MRREAAPADTLCVLQLAALGLGGLVIPVAYAQYFVMALPVLALLAARALLWTSATAARVANTGGVTARGVAIALLVLMCARPVRSMVALLDPPHAKARDHLAILGYVVENTRPPETFLDGFSGFGVFRPHAYRYFFLHDEVRALLAGPELDRLLGQLRDGTISPSFVVLDRDLRALPADIVLFLEANYEPTAVPPLWRRRDIWLDDPARAGRVDLGGGETDALAGQGWYRPEGTGDRTFRQGRGRRSSLRLPLRNAGTCRSLVISARLQYAVAAPRIEVRLNGTALGVLSPSEEWQDYRVALPSGLARSGMNTLRFLYDPVPREADPAFEGRNALVAVDDVVVQCAPLP